MKDEIITGDCLEVLKGLVAESVDLIITSPPYNLGIVYDASRLDGLDNLSLQDYLSFIEQVARECHRVLRNGGRICWNIPNQIRANGVGEIWSPLIRIGHILEITDFKFYDVIFWNQGYSVDGTAWGSWCSPSQPHIRHQVESVLIFYKGERKIQHKGETDLTANEFVKLTRSEIWGIRPEMNRQHPAPFPEELPARLIKLFSYKGDVVLDPFVGSGTTSTVAHILGRKSIGIEINPKYAEIARARIKLHQEQMKLSEA